MSAPRWTRGGFNTAAHLTLPGRKTLCGTHLGYGIVEGAPDYARRCQRCVKLADKPEPAQLCQWYALCTNEATTTRPHPILGDVPICTRCDGNTAALEGAGAPPVIAQRFAWLGDSR